MSKNILQKTVKSLPDKPGVYQFFDKDEKILYVGKAKSLKKRVNSYFTKESHESGKEAVLVSKIKDVKFIVVNNELDALLLENNLIKKHQPRYNIQLKDDKSFPWICVKNEPFPRIFPTRNVIHDGSSYFGPYASVRLMNTLLELVRQLHPLRNCKLNLSEKNIKQKKYKVCLEYHIGNCLGPCESLQTSEDYENAVIEIKQILKGNISMVVKQLKELMNKYADNLDFEKAQIVKDKLELLEKFQSKSTIVNPTIHNVDVFSINTDKKNGYVNFIKVVNGAIVQAHTVEIRKKLDESAEEILALSITDFRQRFQSNAREIILPFEIDMNLPGVNIVVPQRGDKKKLLDLSERNVHYYRIDKEKQQDLVDPERHTKRVLSSIQKDLRLKEIPTHIECFDNSNFQGDYPVAAMVVFKNAKPDKKGYRHYNIKTVKGPDDYSSMTEIVFRRYKRLLDEEKSLPQLIVIDGGKGQLNAALKSLERLSLRGKISIIGIAKRLEEIYYPDDPAL